MKFLLNILLLALCVCVNAQTSKRIEIINADSTIANTIDHPEYLRLLNNVVFKHNSTTMSCDSAYHYSSLNKIEAFGDIIIQQGDSLRLTGNKLRYLSDKNSAVITGKVKLIDKYMTLETEKIIYNLNKNIGVYPSNGKIIDNSKSIYSVRGEYHASTYNFIFTDSVKIIDKEYQVFTDNMIYNTKSETSFFFGPSIIVSEENKIFCENGWYNTNTLQSKFFNNAYIQSDSQILKGDSIFYDQNKQYGKALQSVHLIDSINNIEIFGNQAEFFIREDYFIFTKEPLAKIIQEEDTTFISANNFLYQNLESDKKLIAFNNVEIYQHKMQAKCDSFSHDLEYSKIELFDNPTLWIDEFQITSDSMKIFLDEDENLKSMICSPNPMIVSKVDSFNYNQLAGSIMNIYFNENTISKIRIEGNSQSLFVISDEKTNDKIGFNATKCSEISLYFKENKIESINYNVKPNSTITPYNEIKENDKYLDGFIWKELDQQRIKLKYLIDNK